MESTYSSAYTVTLFVKQPVFTKESEPKTIRIKIKKHIFAKPKSTAGQETGKNNEESEPGWVNRKKS